MTRASAGAASQASESQPTVQASPRVRTHRRQWTHSNLDGTKMVRLHRSPVPPPQPAEEEEAEEADAAAASAASADDASPAATEEQEDEEAAAVPRTRRARQATPAKVKNSEQRRLFTAPVPMAIEEEDEEEENEEEPQQQQEEQEEEESPEAIAEEEEEEDAESADSDSDSSEEEGLGAGADDMDQEDRSAADEEEDDDDDDAWVQNMGKFAAAELSRRLKTAPGASAAAAAASSSAAAASSSSAKPRAATAAAATGTSANRVVPSVSNLDSMFTPRKSAPSSSAAAAAALAAAAAVPHGFVRKAGVLLLSDSTMNEATAGDGLAHPSAAHAPDLLASLGARSAAAPLPNSNPVQASKAQRQSSAPTAGKDWFNLSRPSALTPELKSDLKLLSLRAYMDPKKFYKKESKKKKVIPTFFQVGTVIAGAQDFYSARLTNAQRTNHYADELIDPAKSVGGVKKMKHYLKRKVIELQTQNQPAPRTHFNKKRKMMDDASKRPGSKKRK